MVAKKSIVRIKSSKMAVDCTVSVKYLGLFLDSVTRVF